MSVNVPSGELEAETLFDNEKYVSLVVAVDDKLAAVDPVESTVRLPDTVVNADSVAFEDAILVSVVVGETDVDPNEAVGDGV